MATAVDVDAVAASLYHARRDRVPVAPLTDQHPGMSAEDAYRVQQGFVARLLADGASVVGYKLGLTSAPMQEMFGVETPDYGPVLSSFVLGDGAPVDSSAFIAPRVEAEIAVVLDAPLAGPRCTPLEVARAVAGYVAAVEIVDSRISNWKIKLPDTVADLASCGAIALSSRIAPAGDWDPRLLGMVFTRNGQVVASGAGAAALGGPLSAVAWLVETLNPLGVSLEPGQFVMTGALHAAVPLTAGDVFRADFDRLGPVTVRVT
jgi:2-keto-4-pentenoate hydratase